jgi:hypothetical protein
MGMDGLSFVAIDFGLLIYTQFAYSFHHAYPIFETTTFTATVGHYLTDDEYRLLQSYMLEHPEVGDVMPRTGGFRKLRWFDERRGKGKRGGLRVIYYWLMNDRQFWMFAI